MWKATLFNTSYTKTKSVSLGLNSDSRTQGFGGHFYMYFLKKMKYNKSKGEEREMKTIY
jgi:hypothetical protein